MKRKSIYLGVLAIALCLLLVAPATAQQKKKKRPSRARGNVGLVDTEKNYLIVVTPKGKLVEVHFNDKTRVTKLVPQKAEIKDIRLRSNASITYTKKGDKNVLKAIKFESRGRRGKGGKGKKGG